MKKYWIKEIFGPTINGEGSKAGEVVKFLRFAGCNRWSGKPEHKAQSVCWYCDTDFVGGDSMLPEEIVLALEALGPIKKVVISGGEATLQLDEEILDALISAGFRLYLETNGSRPLHYLRRYFEHVTMSPKQSFEKTKLESCDDIKLLFPYITDEITISNFDKFLANNKYLQPVEIEGNYQMNALRASEVLYHNPDWKMSVQLHKVIGVK